MGSDQKEALDVPVLDGRDGRVLDELAQVRSKVDELVQHMAALDAVEDQHRVELNATRAEATEAQAALREWQAKAEEWRRQLKETKHRLETAESRVRRAEEDRSAVIAALGRKGRRLLGSSSSAD